MALQSRIPLITRQAALPTFTSEKKKKLTTAFELTKVTRGVSGRIFQGSAVPTGRSRNEKTNPAVCSTPMCVKLGGGKKQRKKEKKSSAALIHEDREGVHFLAFVDEEEEVDA